MKKITFGLLFAITATSLIAQDSGPRTDWKIRGGASKNMEDPMNWTNGLPDEKTITVVKGGTLSLGSNPAEIPTFKCQILSFQDDTDDDAVPMNKDLEVVSGNLTMMGSDLKNPNRWPNNGNLHVHQTGGMVFTASELIFGVKPNSILNYEMDGGNLRATKLSSGDGKVEFKQTGGELNADEFLLGGVAPGVTEYTISGGTLKFQKLLIGRRNGPAEFKISGKTPTISGEELQLMPTGKLVFVTDNSGVASLGSLEHPLSKAALKGTLELKQSEPSSKSGQVVNLIYAMKLAKDEVKLDQESANHWDIFVSKEGSVSVLGLKAK